MSFSAGRSRRALQSGARLACLGLCVAALGSSGCARCSDKPRVPFKLPHGNDTLDAPPPEAPSELTPPDAGNNGTQVFVPAIDRPLIAGQALPLTHVHAALERDLDGDGDGDVLALHEDEAHGAHLWLVTRSAEGFAEPREVAAFFRSAVPGECSIATARIEALSRSKAVVTVERACKEPRPKGTPSATLSLLSIAGAPRVYEQIDVLAPSDDSAPLALTPTSSDVDGDGHDDIVLSVRHASAPEGDALRLVWLDRPSGLVRDLREPEATLSAWARAAESLANKAPEQAAARAELALTLERALCRELGSAELALSGTLGVPCGAAKSTGALLATLVVARVKRNDLGGAFAAYRELARSEPRPPPRTLEQASNALAQLRPTAPSTLRTGPSVEPVKLPRVHLPSARFVGESLLYVQRARPVLYDLERSEESAPASASDPLLRDPSGQLVATALERTCEGIAARLERAPPRGSDYVAGPAVAWATLVPLPNPAGCTRGAARAEDLGYRVLGWAPQGLVAVRGREVRLASLTSSGQASEPPRVLANDAPRPAPLPSGSATVDGSRYVEATVHGVLVYGPKNQIELWRPEGYTAVAREPLEAAISPSARRVAVVSAGTVYLVEL